MTVRRVLRVILALIVVLLWSLAAIGLQENLWLDRSYRAFEGPLFVALSVPYALAWMAMRSGARGVLWALLAASVVVVLLAPWYGLAGLFALFQAGALEVTAICLGAVTILLHLPLFLAATRALFPRPPRPV